MSKHWFIALAGLVLLSGCASVPNHQESTQSTEQYLASLQFAIDAQAADADSAAASDWWRGYQDDQLNRLVAIAQQRSLDLQASQKRIDSTLALLGENRSALLPQGSVGGEYTVGERDGVREESSAVGASVSWELDLFGRLRSLIEARESDLELALQTQREILKEVTVGVVRAYLTWEAADDRVALIRRDIESLEESLGLIDARVAEGLAPRLDLVRAQSLLRQQKTQLPGALADRYRAKAVLAVLVNEDPDQLHLVPGPRALEARVPVPAPNELAEALKYRADIAAALATVAREVALTEAATAELYPQINLDGFAGFTNLADRPDGFEDAWSLMPRISWSLLSYPALLNRLDSQQALSDEAYIRYRGTVIKAVADARVSVVNVRRTAEADDASARALASAKEAYEIAEAMHAEGAIGYLEFLDASRTWIAAQQTRLEAKLGQADARLTLLAEFSGLWTAQTQSRLLTALTASR